MSFYLLYSYEYTSGTFLHCLWKFMGIFHVSNSVSDGSIVAFLS